MGVSIYPQAIKPTVDLEDGVTVYVPGYSYIGPEEPTLCSSESEFENIFGSTPYLFEADQLTSKISKGSPEKGYLYAKSLLASGLRVLFHRYKTPGSLSALGSFTIHYWPKGEREASQKYLVAQALSFGKFYDETLVKLTYNSGSLFNVNITDSVGDNKGDSLISLDPNNPLYIRLANLPIIKFMGWVPEGSSGRVVELEDTFMELLSGLTYQQTLASLAEGEYCIVPSTTVEGKPNSIKLSIAEGGPTYEFYLDDSGSGSSQIKGMLSSLADNTSAGMMYPLKDFEKYPSVAYLTTGGYYTEVNPSIANTQLVYAQAISAVALIDWNKNISESTWVTAKAAFAGITGTVIAKGKSAAFAGCNSFEVSPYRIILADSFNYLKSLGENIKAGINSWLPVANDPNGVSPLGYDSTQKISTDLAETMAEGNTGVSVNPIIYSNSAGGYKIMGNRTLVSNDGVLGPQSFLNIAVVVNRVERACRQAANKLKIVSTNPDETFLKFKQWVSRTIDPMLIAKDGVLSYRIKHLPKTKPATIDIQIHLVVLEGIEKFNVYIPYELSLD